jgi:hypothetical protein
MIGSTLFSKPKLRRDAGELPGAEERTPLATNCGIQHCFTRVHRTD